MSRRKLRPEELRQWQSVARTADRLHPERAPTITPFHDPAPSPRNDAPQPVEKFQIGQAAKDRTGSHDVLPGVTDRLASAPVHMDKKAFHRLKRGKLRPEARIDLHGMTLDQAQPALTGFIMSAQARDRRLVLVISGKGRRGEDPGPIPARHGVLRHAVPVWLKTPPLSRIVLQISQAHLRHGGGGAYYVYLRRRRD